MAAGTETASAQDVQQQNDAETKKYIKEEDVTEDGGLIKKVIKEGEGWQTPASGAEVTVHYVGTLLDGTEFDSSRSRNTPFTFKIGAGQVIKGWDKGVATMKKGEVSLLVCKPEYAYGASGSPPKIPPNATLQFEVELLSWTDEKDVSEAKDGGIMKKVLEEKDKTGWETPREESQVTVKLTGRLLDGTEFEPQHEHTFVVGEEQAIEGLDVAVATMKKGERSLVTIQPKYAYGEKGDPSKGVPPNAAVQYEVELVDFVKEKESWDMTPEEKWTAAQKRKNDGNDLFKESKYKRAIKKYKKALTYLDAEYGMNDEQKAKTKELKTPLYLNLAACKLGTKQYKEVKEDCNKALEIDPKNVKGFIRRAKANIELDEWDNAKTDLTKALEIDKDNVDAKHEMARLKKKIADQAEKDRKTFGGMFEKLSKQQ